MNFPLTSARDVREGFLLGREQVLIDLRTEHDFAQAHPLFAAQLPLALIECEAPVRIPRLATPVILYGEDERAAFAGAAGFVAMGYSAVSVLEGGIAGWETAGFELFQDVNSYSKAFGELVEARRHTPWLAAPDVAQLIADGADIAVMDARRFDEYATMSIPGGTSVPGAELVLRAASIAPDPATTIIVNCAGRTRSIIGTQSLINAGVPNPVRALRNGTIGWSLDGLDLDTGAARRFPEVDGESARIARERARAVSYRAGVRHIDTSALTSLQQDPDRTLYRFDVRTPEEHIAGHPAGFMNAPGGQLVQEIDSYAPVRGARIVLADDRGVRADMTASWLAQLRWEVFVLDGGFDAALETGLDALAKRGPDGRYRRPYEGTDNPAQAMQAYLDWEYGLVAQLERDRTHGFFVI